MIATRVSRIDPVGATVAVGLAAVAVWLAAVWRLTDVTAPFVAVVAVTAAAKSGVLVAVYRRERREAERWALPPATAVTLLRGGAVAVLSGFLVVRPEGPLAWLPVGLYAAAAGLDAADGVVARRTDSVTATGARLDTEVDALGLLVGAALAVRLGAAPAAYLLVGLARYAFLAGVGLRRRLGRPVRPLPASPVRRYNAGAQMVVVILLLAPRPAAAHSRLLAAVAMLPFLAVFLRDWLLVTGRLDEPHL